MTTYAVPAGDRIYGGRVSPVRNPSLALVTWPPGANCTIPDAEGVNAPIHPKVLDFGSAWNGYRYWMAFTPYPDTASNDLLENPCVVASNDGDTWIAPVANPIVPAPVGAAQNTLYNSDTHLLFVGGVLYLIWRLAEHASAGSNTITERLYYKTTTNGIAWSSAVLFFDSFTTTGSKSLSPCVEYYDNEFWMWLYRRDTSPNACDLLKSASINGPWSARTRCTLSLPSGDKELWHFDVCRIPNGWAMLIGTTPNASKRVHWLSYSKDGVSWATPAIFPAGDPGVYRSSMARAGSGFDCWIGDWDARKIRRTRIEDAQI